MEIMFVIKRRGWNKIRKNPYKLYMRIFRNLFCPKYIVFVLFFFFPCSCICTVLFAQSNIAVFHSCTRYWILYAPKYIVLDTQASSSLLILLSVVIVLYCHRQEVYKEIFCYPKLCRTEHFGSRTLIKNVNFQENPQN